MERILQAEGHCVYTASTLEEALGIAGLAGAELDVLICDVFLQNDSGLEVSAAIHAICPTVKHVLVSGEFTPAANDPPLVINTIPYTVLPKPFTKEQLTSVITRLTN